VRALLVGRKQLQHKLTDIELSLRCILRGFGLKVGKVTDKTFEARIRKLVTGQQKLPWRLRSRGQPNGTTWRCSNGGE